MLEHILARLNEDLQQYSDWRTEAITANAIYNTSIECMEELQHENLIVDFHFPTVQAMRKGDEVAYSVDIPVMIPNALSGTTLRTLVRVTENNE